jgi:hypothetical protein
VQKLLDHIYDYPLGDVLWSHEANCSFYGETHPKKKASYYRTKAKVRGRLIYLGQKGVESEFRRLLARIELQPDLAEGCKSQLLDRLKGRIPGQREAEAQKLRTHCVAWKKRRKL